MKIASIVRVFVVDDHDVVRQGLISILEEEEDFAVAGQASSAEEALSLMKDTVMDVIVLDYRLPGMSGVEMCRELAESRSAAGIVILSSYDDEESAWASLAAGAKGYVVKDANATELKAAIRQVARGELYLDPRVSSRMAAWARRGSTGVPLLSAPVRRVLRLAVEGNTNIQIARKMNLSVHTVKSHLSTAYRKLGVRDRVQAASVALKLKLF